MKEMANHIKSKSKKDFSRQCQQTSEVAGMLDKNYRIETGYLKTKPGSSIYRCQDILV
jgi:hypothetical protein